MGPRAPGAMRGLFLGVLAAAVAACGGSSHTSTTAAAVHPAQPATFPVAFSWVAKPAPGNWPSTQIPSGAALVYPPGWHLAHGDSGTATATQTASGRILGYLNLTPRQGSEQLSTWASFRVKHNHEEGNRSTKVLAHATHLRFAAGQASCIKDLYTTAIGARYIEIACLVAGSRATSVIVGAAPPAQWNRFSGAIEQAIAGVRT